MSMCLENLQDAADDIIDGLVQERRNSMANALELQLSCPKPWIYIHIKNKLDLGVPKLQKKLHE